MDGKSLLTSKTFWANVIAFLATIATATGHPLVGATIANPETQVQVIAGVTTVANIVLRLVTKQPIISIK